MIQPMRHIQWFHFFRIGSIDLSTVFSHIIGILDYSRYFHSSRPIVVIETLEISYLLNLITVQVSSVLNQNVSGGSSCPLVHMLSYHKELPEMHMSHLWIYYCSWLTITILWSHLLLSSLSSAYILHWLVLLWIWIRNIKLVFDSFIYYHYGQLRIIIAFHLLT